MRFLFISCLISVFLASTLEARDQVSRGTEGAKGTLDYNATDGTIMSSSHQYPPTIQGLRQYLNQELILDKQEYHRLNSRLGDLEKQDQMAFRISLIPTGLGFGSLLVGSFLRHDDEPTDPQAKNIHDQGGRLMLYGLGGIVGGFILNELIAPDKDDIHNFIEFHNGMTGQESGRTSTNQGPSLSVNLFAEDTFLALSYKF